MLQDNKGVFTTLVRVKGSDKVDVIPVKTSEPMDKDLWIECSKALSRLRVGPPLRVGDILCKNILNTGIDVICTRTLNK